MEFTLNELMTFFSESSFMPHGHCYLWKPALVALHVSSDMLLFISFEIILFILLLIVKKSREKIPFDWAIVAISSLFLLCGLTHLMEVWNLWNSNYWLGGALKSLTAIASVLSIIFIIPAVPAILKLPTPTDLLEINNKLKETLKEKDRLQQSLIAKEKLASLGTVSAGIAHEIKNPINLMINSANYIEDFLSEDFKPYREIFLKQIPGDKRKNFVDDLDDAISGCSIICTNGHRADSIIKNMLEQTRSSSVTFEMSDIKKVIEETLRLSYQSAKVKYNMPFQLELNLVEVDRIKIIYLDMFRAFTNLFENSFFELNEKRKLLGEEFNPILKVDLKLSKGKKIEIIIRDNGTGISQDIIESIFIPFFTTKAAGEGTGLGLSMVNDIVSAHEGEILCNSIVNEFTEFKIFLPVETKGEVNHG